MPVALDDDMVRDAQPRATRYSLADTVVQGLHLRVSPTGHKSWTILYREKGGAGGQRLSLGVYPRVSLSKARIAAQARLGAENPQVEHQRRRQVAKRGPGRPRADVLVNTTVGAIARAMVEDTKNIKLADSTRKEWRRLVDVEIVPALGELQATTLPRTEVRRWAEAIRDGERWWVEGGGQAAGYTANRAFEVLRRAINYGIERDTIPPVTPFVQLPKPFGDERSSDRVLSAVEVGALLRALDSEPRADSANVYGQLWRMYADVVRLLLLTAFRRSAVLGMHRGQLEDLEGKEPLWVVPRDQKGNKAQEVHVVPLSKPAVTIIQRRLEAVATQHLFPVGRFAAGEDRPATWPTSFVTELEEQTLAQLREWTGNDKATMRPWRIHDLRHTVATHLTEVLKVDPGVVSLIMGHTPTDSQGKEVLRVSRVYNRAKRLAERRDALKRWAIWLEQQRRLKVKK